MPDIKIREHIIAGLKPLLPKKWALQPFSGVPDNIAVPTVILSLQSYSRAAIAPRAARTASFVLTVLEPKIAPGPADDALDDDLLDLLNAIDLLGENAAITWSTAERGTASGQPGFDITTTFTYTLDSPEQETN